MEFDPKHICLMEERTSTNTYQGWINNRPDVASTPNSSAKTITVAQYRWPYTYNPDKPLLSFSFFNKTQAANLLALIATITSRRRNY